MITSQLLGARVAALLVAVTGIAVAGIACDDAYAHGKKKKAKSSSSRVEAREHFRLRLVGATIASRKASGRHWDVDGSAPDVVATIKSGSMKRKSSKSSSLTPHWHDAPIAMPAGSSFSVKLIDKDVLSDDTIATFAFRDDGTDGEQCFTSSNGVAELCIETTPVDVWVIGELQVTTVFALNDAWEKKIRKVLLDFHRRLVDVTDGQIRIERFALYSPPWPKDLDPHAGGSLHFHARWEDADDELADTHKHPKRALACAHSLGRPKRPAHMHVPVTKDGKDVTDILGNTLTHEFGHAYLGLDDEYLSDATIGCPDSRKTPVCMMNGAADGYREVCRSSNHDKNGDTEQTATNHADCWTSMGKLLKKDVGLDLIKSDPIRGPKPFTSPTFTVWRNERWSDD